MSDFNALYNRYLSEANAYAAKFGLDPRTRNTDGHWDAFRHAFASAAMTKDYGRIAAHLFGDLNEKWRPYDRSIPGCALLYGADPRAVSVRLRS